MIIRDDPPALGTWHHTLLVAVAVTGSLFVFRFCSCNIDSVPRPPQRRYLGLLNEGNSCYINSVLFALASILHRSHRPITFWNLFQIHQRASSSASCFSKTLIELLEELNLVQSETRNLSVSQRLSIQHTGRQHDAHEFLSALLQTLNQTSMPIWSLKAARQVNTLLPWDSLTMQVVGCPICISKGLVPMRLEICSIHTVCGSNNSLVDALSPSTEILKDHKRDVDHCKFLVEHGDFASIKLTATVRWPVLLFVHRAQIDRSMSIPVVLKLKRSIPCIFSSSHICKYKLCAAVVHQSSHFFTVRRLPDSDRWLYCSDTTVVEVDNPLLYLNRAYILFYESFVQVQ